MKVEVKITNGNGKSKTYQLSETAPATKNAKGKMSLSHFQPAQGNEVVKGFSKLYIDTIELGKALKS